MLPCWLLGVVGIMWCCAVMFPEEGLDLLTALFTNRGEKTFAAAVPPLSTQFISSITLILILFWRGKQLSTSGAIPGFIKLKGPVGGGESDAWLVSVLFVPFGKSPLSAHREALEVAIEHISVGKLAPLSPK